MISYVLSELFLSNKTNIMRFTYIQNYLPLLDFGDETRKCIFHNTLFNFQ